MESEVKYTYKNAAATTSSCPIHPHSQLPSFFLYKKRGGPTHSPYILHKEGLLFACSIQNFCHKSMWFSWLHKFNDEWIKMAAKINITKLV